MELVLVKVIYVNVTLQVGRIMDTLGPLSHHYRLVKAALFIKNSLTFEKLFKNAKMNEILIKKAKLITTFFV